MTSGRPPVANGKPMLTETRDRRDQRAQRLQRQLRAALERQQQAHRAHPIPSLAERRADLLQLKAFLLDHQQAICEAISADYGHRSAHETLLMELLPAVNDIKATIKALPTWMKPQKRAVDRKIFGLADNRVIPQPLGVVGVIVPWNFPINLSFVPLSAILAAGNRACVKFSEHSRHLAKLLIETLPAYFPPGQAAVL